MSGIFPVSHKCDIFASGLEFLTYESSNYWFNYLSTDYSFIHNYI